MFTEREFRIPRLWSNAELRRIGALVEGGVVNVSGWKDSDKDGGHYRDYFPRASHYDITNFGGYRGLEDSGSGIFLDLTAPLPEDLREKFDVVFNHTTLEHIFEIDAAFDALCGMSRDLVIVVVPFIQIQHEKENVLDYWRFTPTALREMFRRRGFGTVYEAANAHAAAGIYILFVASRHPERWRGKMPDFQPLHAVGTAALTVFARKSVGMLANRVRGAVRCLTMSGARKSG